MSSTLENLLLNCAEASEAIENRNFNGSHPRLLRKNSELQAHLLKIQENLHSCAMVYAPPRTELSPSSSLKAVAWNIERGKNFDSLAHLLQNHPEISDADLYLLTEVDWGMARSGNRNVAADLGRALQKFAYFAPCYFNFTKGHGPERRLPGVNRYGLEGKAILSRFPLEDLEVIALSNATDKLGSKEAQLGERRALGGHFSWNGKRLKVVCTHLDSFSSPKARANQLKAAMKAGQASDHVLMGGDWNTNTLNSSSGVSIFFGIMRQFFLTGPKEMVRTHHPYPDRYFDRPLFEMLKSEGFDYENCNELGVGTYDFFSQNRDLFQMVNDRFPPWIFKLINRLVDKSGSFISLKLDWFAGKNIRYIQKKVLPLQAGKDYRGDRPSDHHPILLTFSF